MQMWGFWARTKQARSNPSRGQSHNGNHIERRTGTCTRSSVKPPAEPARVEIGSQEVTSTYVYVDNFR